LVKVVAVAGGGHRLELGTVRTHNYVTLGTPDVAWAVPGSAEPWRITLHQGGSTVYTWTKANSVTANWANQRSASFGNAIVSPTLGTMYYPFLFFSMPRAVSLTTSTPF
jgi:hypothetical protein